MYVLGINAYYHDSAAALIKDGEVVCAFEEERFSRIKHDNRFPRQAIEHCLSYADISTQEIDAVAYYEKPLRRFERILETFVDTYPYSLKTFVDSMPEWLGTKIRVEKEIRNTVGSTISVYFIPHHHSHAAAAFYSSPFDAAAILTVDGVGEYETTAIWHAKGTTLTQLKTIEFPHSLGLFYSTLTSFLGFQVNEGEYKMMGLAAYGVPRYVDAMRELITLHEDGSFTLNMKYFSFQYSMQMWHSRLEKLLGVPRRPKASIEQHHADIAASVQKITEEVYTNLLSCLYDETKTSRLCVGGGVALNALANGAIQSKTPFTDVSILGASGDNGAALGAAYTAYHCFEKGKQHTSINDLALGNEYTNTYIKDVVSQNDNIMVQHLTDQEVIEQGVQMLLDGKVIGWFQGRMEFGPRALGRRSILSAPYPASQAQKVNTIKHREYFRPFAGSILAERAQEYFELPDGAKRFPFMNFCFPVRIEQREKLSAITHADNTCRIQTVSSDAGRFRALLEGFYERTGIPCLLNTSFNRAREPIVESPEQALATFLETPMDVLFIGNYLIQKNEGRE